jgi:tetratricopeptide (TPR) repeat protein
MKDASLIETVSGLMKAGQWKRAIVLCMSAPASDLTLDVLWNWAWACFKVDQFAAARSLFERALELQPDSTHARWGLGTTLRELGEFDESVLHLQRALHLADSAMVRQELALVFMQKRDLASAELVHLEGLRLKPASSERIQAYGDFLSDCGREGEAAIQFAQAQKIGLDRGEPG